MLVDWTRYFWNLLIALDQLANTILLGDPDETISSRIAKNQTHPCWSILGAVLEWIDPGHLQRSVEWDEGRMAAKGYVKARLDTERE